MASHWTIKLSSNLAYKRLAATNVSEVWFSYSYNWIMASGAVFILLSSGAPELFISSYCAWLWLAYWLTGPNCHHPPPPAWSIFLMLYRFYKLTETEQSAANTAYETCCVFTAIARLVSSHSGRHKTSAKGRYSRQGLMLPSRLCELLFWWQPFCTSWKGP